MLTPTQIKSVLFLAPPPEKTLAVPYNTTLSPNTPANLHFFISPAGFLSENSIILKREGFWVFNPALNSLNKCQVGPNLDPWTNPQAKYPTCEDDRFDSSGGPSKRDVGLICLTIPPSHLQIIRNWV